MEIIRPGDTYRDEFTVLSAAGAGVDADALPTAQVYRNGVLDATVAVTVANLAAGAYTLSFAVPTSYSPGDYVRALVSSTVGGVDVPAWSGKVTLAQFPATALPNAAAPVLTGTVNDAAPTAGGFAGDAALDGTHDDIYQGIVLVFTTGALRGIGRKVSSYTAATRSFAFTGSAGAADAPFPVAPADGDAFELLGRIG